MIKQDYLNIATIDNLEELCQTVSDAPQLLRVGQAAMNNSLYSLAVKCFQKVTEISPDNLFALSWQALAQLGVNPTSVDAVKLLSKSGILENSSFLCHLSIIVEKAWLEKGAFMKHIELPDSQGTKKGTPPYNKVSRMAEKNDWHSVYNELIQYAAKSDETVFSLALACEMSGAYRQSQQYLDLLSPAVQDYFHVKATRARILVRLREFRKAVSLMEQITISGPEDYGLCYYWGIIMFAYQQPEQAMKFFSEAFSIHNIDTMDYIFPQIERNILLSI